jgi:hypothetical protein
MDKRYRATVFAAYLLVGAAIAPLLSARPAQADETVAYCDLPEYAINVYRASGSKTTRRCTKCGCFGETNR